MTSKAPPVIPCGICGVVPVDDGGWACRTCRDARRVRLDDVAGPTVADLDEIGELDADDLCDEVGYEIPPEVTPEPAGATAWICDCGRSFKTAAGLGGHRPCKAAQPAVVEPQPAMANSRLFDLVDLAIGWSCLTPGQQDTARAVCRLDPAELAVVVGIAGRFADRTTRVFDRLKTGAGA